MIPERSDFVILMSDDVEENIFLDHPIHVDHAARLEISIRMYVRHYPLERPLELRDGRFGLYIVSRSFCRWSASSSNVHLLLSGVESFVCNLISSVRRAVVVSLVCP